MKNPILLPALKYFFNLVLLLLFIGCGISNDYNDLKTENLILQQRIDSLSNELNDLKFGSANTLKAAQLKVEDKDYIAAKSLLKTLVSKYPTAPEFNTAKKLLKTVTPKAEEQSFIVLQKNENIDSFKAYLEEYPKGTFSLKVNKLIKQYQKRSNLNASNNDVSNNTNSEEPTTKKYKKNTNHVPVRIGAICCDGTRSYATGRGACSHHGGVCQWLYE